MYGLALFYILCIVLVVVGVYETWPTKSRIVEHESLEQRKQRLWEESLYK